MEAQEIINNITINSGKLTDKWNLLILHALNDERIPIDKKILITKIENTQKSLFKNSPTLGAMKWYVVKLYYLLEDYFAVLLEDGHVMNYAILKYKFDEDKFELVIEAIG
ncbi:MAG: hypothetical protein HPY66_1286 [Firmicutes bacterium]|nr:hypothetical protein [Bacillota bacterium]